MGKRKFVVKDETGQIVWESTAEFIETKNGKSVQEELDSKANNNDLNDLEKKVTKIDKQISGLSLKTIENSDIYNGMVERGDIDDNCIYLVKE